MKPTPTPRRTPMKSRPLQCTWFAGTALFLAASAAPAQAPARPPQVQDPKPLTQEELLRQIETLSPASSDPGRRTRAVMPVPGTAPKAVNPEIRGATASTGTAAAPSLFPGGTEGALPVADNKT